MSEINAVKESAKPKTDAPYCGSTEPITSKWAAGSWIRRAKNSVNIFATRANEHGSHERRISRTRVEIIVRPRPRFLRMAQGKLDSNGCRRIVSPLLPAGFFAYTSNASRLSNEAICPRDLPSDSLATTASYAVSAGFPAKRLPSLLSNLLNPCPSSFSPHRKPPPKFSAFRESS